MEQLSGNVQKASTHRSGVGVDIAAVERDCATVDVDATSALPNNKRTSVKSEHPNGAMGWFNWVGSGQLTPYCEHRREPYIARQ